MAAVWSWASVLLWRSAHSRLESPRCRGETEQTTTATSEPEQHQPKNITVAVPSAIKHMAGEGTLSFLPSRTEADCHQLPSASLSGEEGLCHATSVGTKGKKVPVFSKNGLEHWALVSIRVSTASANSRFIVQLQPGNGVTTERKTQP